ncbi:hypothetical protein RND71_021175 [Anisodus tanguticus]|uniref:R13L1/DRL21-like LRR repeat region domain-containing protein n=1 Tax=Anisodus tanguticus TaxID=243964 RepID=A0AAE1VCK5_9SOLA|nr:hypothetical protein RND71_021175 [Anisodus tanguticus]
MEKLINLRHLDVSYTSRLKIPLYPSKLKKLHVLFGVNFLLGDRNAPGVGDLGELHNLYGSLSILELQTVVERRDASKTNLREKEHVKTLSLEWSGTLGQLPSLKFLSIRGLHRITEVTIEFYGSSFFKRPFNSLEKLEFAKMREWKQWHVLGNGEFPALQYLSIEDCPKLIGKLPENLSTLIGLIIEDVLK